MAVPAELETGRTESGQEEPLVRIPADPDEGRFGQRGSPIEKPFRLGRFGDHGKVRAHGASNASTLRCSAIAQFHATMRIASANAGPLAQTLLHSPGRHRG